MNIVLAGGGTTGHIAPLIATAEALRAIDPELGLSCVGTPIGLERTVVPAAGLELDYVDPVPLPRTASLKLVSLPFRLLKAVHQASSILKARQAQAVVGFGGYASLPVFLAARWRRVPLVVHEANAVAGLANRIGARFAATTCVTFSNTGLKNQVVTGMPVRAAIAGLDRQGLRAQARQKFSLPEGGPVLLVSGGSQGARSLNESLVGALPALDAAGISVLHVTGAKNFEESVPTSVSQHSRYVRLAYVDRMDLAYAAADLMLARSGAGTVTETAIVGLPTIFVPLPHGNGEQAKNAASLIEADAGIMIHDADLTSETLAAQVVSLVTEPGRLESMSQRLRDLMPPDSARRVADLTLDAARGNHASR
ncbi:MAG: undecaprenyldiphospho-muramoylpentapeptide beta-N-acetylglucosaminyltransferase [Propionibacteriaceae bacterium]|jgi:UDP-N-acetylglucosamine--N-acetylmuramyl-(pentapeptide) pyrophosphoryl-undecaprenol N-acetylglucosamine transferase|nr:undecaprenyldiphospho-muramoylpentapeptide beta-N-acetylglucosaminyltransferase [Propionibacteriaceae bacterium]